MDAMAADAEAPPECDATAGGDGDGAMGLAAAGGSAETGGVFPAKAAIWAA